MGLLSGIARFCLVVINILFLLIGLALAVVGFILRFSKTIWEPVLREGIDQLKKVGEDTDLLKLDTSSLDLSSIILSLAIGLIVGGLVLCVLSFLGCCGACYKINIVLWVYVIIIGVFVVGEAVALGLLYGKPELVKDELKKNSVAEYEGLGSSKVLSLGWNIVMINGCYDKIWGVSFGKTAIAIPVLVICGIVQIAFIILAVLIIKFGKETVSPV